MMEQKIKDIVNDYNKHAFDNIPSVFFTVMLWMASQSLIQEVVKQYTPDLQTWQLAAVEIFLASFGLWYVTRKKDKPEDKKNEVTPDAQVPEVRGDV